MTINVNREALLEKLHNKKAELETKYEKEKKAYDVARTRAFTKAKNELAKMLEVEDALNISTSSKVTSVSVTVTVPLVMPKNPDNYNSDLNKIQAIDKLIGKLEIAVDENVKVTDKDDYFMYL